MKKVLGALVLLFLVFFHIYPQALPVFGYSFIFASGLIGLAFYFFNGRSFPEIVSISLAYAPFVVVSFVAGYMNFGLPEYLWSNTKSQFAWLFSAYLIVFLFFYIHPKGNYTKLLSYVAIAVLIQGVISIAMYQDPAINNFFTSIQMADALALYKRELTEGERLLGYGTAFFGAGIIYGTTLILIMIIILKQRLNLFGVILWGAIYCFVFFVGLLSARTTLVGLGVSIALAIFLIFMNKTSRKGQFFKFLAISVAFASIGYTMCYVYFPEFADWAFEAFINYQETGEFSTQSSDSLQYMFIFPRTFHQWLFGIGTMNFIGTDVGYSRLLFYGGVPALLSFFFFQLYLVKSAFTRDFAQNIAMISLMVYSLLLNIKGLADVNSFLYIIIVYFLYYKYFIYTPQLYKLEKLNSNKLHYSLQSPSPDRRG